jgi:hypothetical protein
MDMRTIALTLVFVLNLFPTDSRAKIDEGTQYYPLPETVLNELWWKLSGIETARNQTCPEVTSEEELDLALEDIDLYIEEMLVDHHLIQGKIMQMQRACMVAPRQFPDDKEVALAAEGLYHSSNMMALLVDSMTYDLETERGMLQYLHQPLPDFSSSTLELEFLCNNAYGHLGDMVRRDTYELFQILAPYFEEILHFFDLIEEHDLLQPEQEKPGHKRQHPDMVEYEPFSAPA